MSIIKGYIIGNILFGIRGFPIFSKNDIQCKEEEDFQLALNFFDNEDASVTQSQSSGSTSPKAKNLFSFFQ